MSTSKLAFSTDPRQGLITYTVVGFTVLAVALLAVFHVGFQASDDINYLMGALGWLDSFPYVGNSHWTLRHTVTLPTAAFIWLLGLNGFAVSLSNMAYFLAFVAMNAYFVSRFLGRCSAVIVSLLVLTMPGFLIVSTYLNPDIPELFFVALAFWFLLGAMESDQRWPLLVSGAVAGLAFVNRQTSAAFVIFVVLLCLLRPGMPRSRYLPMGIAFLCVVGADWIYLTLMTGNPAYRMQVDFHHDIVDRFAEAARVAAQGRWIDKEGNLSVNVFIDPLLNLFVSQKYPLLFWLLLPAGLAVWRQRHTAQVRVQIFLIGLGLVSFFFVAANPKLYLVPRYFLLVSWAAAVVVAWWLANLWAAERRRLAIAGLTALLIANAAALSVENIHPRMVELALVRWVSENPGESIHTDIETRARSEFYFRFVGIPMDRVIAAAPMAGDRFYYSAQRVEQCATMPRCRDQAADFRPTARWQAELRIVGPRRPVAMLAGAFGLGHILPPDIARRVMAPVDEVIVYKVQ